MCYNAEVSFGTWAFGMLSAWVLSQSGMPLRAMAFPLSVTQMQLVEGLRWIDAVDERVLSVLGKLVLVLQPVAAFVEAKQYGFIAPYLTVQAIVEYLYGSRDLRFTVADDGHFKWNWSFDPVSVQALPYWIGLVIGAWFVVSRPMAIVLLALLGYFYINHAKYETYGSLWCVWVNLMWIEYLLRI